MNAVAVIVAFALGGVLAQARKDPAPQPAPPSQTDPARRKVMPLTRAQYRTKVRAVRAYKSQLRALRCGSCHLMRERRLFAYEVYWSLQR